jgi:hypothetical protein
MSGGGAHNESQSPQCDNPYQNAFVGLALLKDAVYTVVLRSPRDLDTISLNRYTGRQVSLRAHYMHELSDWMVLVYTKTISLSHDEQTVNCPNLCSILDLYQHIACMLAVKW